MNITLSIIFILAVCLGTSATTTTPSNSDFCDAATNPGATTIGPNFVKSTQG